MNPAARAVLLPLVLAAACATGGQRPRYGAAPESVSFLLRLPADSVIRRLAARADSLGIPLARNAPREGYLETAWYDVARARRSAAPFDRLDSIVKLRVFADPSQGKTRVLAEAVRRIAWDPSLPERELERMVPPGHPALALLDSLLVVIPRDTLRAPGGPPL